MQADPSDTTESGAPVVFHTPSLTLSLDGGTYELLLHAPPCNEIGTTMLDSLEGALDRVDASVGHSLIIRSGLDAGFCAGANLRELYAAIADGKDDSHHQRLAAWLDRIHAVMDRIDMLPLTTVGVVHRVCFGGGFELALTCDILIAEKNARFAFPELRLGIIPGFGGIPRLRRDVGNAVVRDLLITGRTFNAKKAQEVGLVSQVVPEGEGVRAARALTTQQAKYDRDARVACKAFMKPLPVAELAAEKAIFLRLFQNDAVTEGLRRFVESTDVRPYLPS
jgi:enoyl-CoA hydratase/carnithine racemase